MQYRVTLLYGPLSSVLTPTGTNNSKNSSATTSLLTTVTGLMLFLGLPAFIWFTPAHPQCSAFYALYSLVREQSEINFASASNSGWKQMLRLGILHVYVHTCSVVMVYPCRLELDMPCVLRFVFVHVQSCVVMLLSGPMFFLVPLTCDLATRSFAVCGSEGCCPEKSY